LFAGRAGYVMVAYAHGFRALFVVALLPGVHAIMWADKIERDAQRRAR
jgi:hypothetical protein